MRGRPAVYISVVIAMLLLAGCTGGPTIRGWSGPAQSASGVLYVGSMDGKVYAINPTARTEAIPFPNTDRGEWEYAIKVAAKASGFGCAPSATSAAFYGPPVISPDGNFIFVASYDGKVYGLSARGGVDPTLWIYPVRDADVLGNIVGAPVLYNDRLIITSADGHLYAITAIGDDRGKLAAQFPAKDAVPLGRIWTTPAIVGDVAYFGTFDGTGYAISLKDFRPIWNEPVKLEAAVASVSAAAGIVLFGTFDSQLWAFDPQRGGAPLWKTQATNWFWPPPLIVADTIYAANLDGKVYAMDVKTGNQRWEFNTGSPVASPPKLSGEQLVVVSQSGNVYAIGKDGTQARMASLGAQVLSAPSIAADGTVYVHATDQRLYAVDLQGGIVKWKYSLTPATQ